MQLIMRELDMDNEISTGDPVIHLMCGSTGAGKSTYANALSNDIQAIHLAIDDWMMSLFGPDLSNSMDWAWISERAARCEDKMVSTAIALAMTGTSSILEIGMQQSLKRSEMVKRITDSNCTYQTHFLNVSASERWQRVQQRNVEQGDTYQLTVTRNMFDFFESMWEQPDENELALLNAVSHS